MALQNFLIDLSTNRIVNPLNPSLGIRPESLSFIEGETYSGAVSLTSSGTVSSFSFELSDEDGGHSVFSKSADSSGYSFILGGDALRSYLYKESDRLALLSLKVETVDGLRVINPLPINLFANPSGNLGGEYLPFESGQALNGKIDQLQSTFSGQGVQIAAHTSQLSSHTTSISALGSQFSGVASGVSGQATSLAATGAYLNGRINSIRVPIKPWEYKTFGFTSVVGGRYQCDTTIDDAFTALLPASPVDGDEVWFEDFRFSWGTLPVTIGGNGKLINDLTGNFLANVAGGEVKAVYSSEAGTWGVK